MKPSSARAALESISFLYGIIFAPTIASHNPKNGEQPIFDPASVHVCGRVIFIYIYIWGRISLISYHLFITGTEGNKDRRRLAFIVQSTVCKQGTKSSHGSIRVWLGLKIALIGAHTAQSPPNSSTETSTPCYPSQPPATTPGFPLGRGSDLSGPILYRWDKDGREGGKDETDSYYLQYMEPDVVRNGGDWLAGWLALGMI
jgi:hypothetical protein